MIAALHSGTLNAQTKLRGLIEHFLFQLHSVKVNNRHVHEPHTLLRVFEASNEKSVAPHVDGEHSTSNQRSKILPVDMTWRVTCGFEPQRASIVCTQNICAQHSAAMQSLETISCATPEGISFGEGSTVCGTEYGLPRKHTRILILYHIPAWGAIARHLVWLKLFASDSMLRSDPILLFPLHNLRGRSSGYHACISNQSVQFLHQQPPATREANHGNQERRVTRTTSRFLCHPTSFLFFL